MTPAVRETVGRACARLAEAGIDAADLEARVLFERASGLDRAGIIARGREAVDPAVGERYERLLEQRVRRAPLAYVTGEREFWSLRLAVDERVLVPRPETEVLVDAALARLGDGARIADIGTGSGAIAIALATELPGATLWAVDRSAAALAAARLNAAAHGVAGRIAFLEGDLAGPLAAFPGGFDAIVANLPYIPSGEIAGLAAEVRDHEPRLALDGGADGLEIIARLVGQAPGLLRRGGWLLLEVGAGQADAVCRMLDGGGAFERAGRVPDLAGIERVVAARRGP